MDVGASQGFNGFGDEIVCVVVIVRIAKHIPYQSGAAEQAVGQASAIIGIKKRGIGDEFTIDADRGRLSDDPAQTIVGIGELPSIRFRLRREQMV